MRQPLIPVEPDGHHSPVYPMWLFFPGLLLIFALAIANAGALLKQGNFAIVFYVFSVLLLAPIAGICSFMGFVLSDRVSGMGRRLFVLLGHLAILALSACLIVGMISETQSGGFF